MDGNARKGSYRLKDPRGHYLVRIGSSEFIRTSRISWKLYSRSILIKMSSDKTLGQKIEETADKAAKEVGLKEKTLGDKI